MKLFCIITSLLCITSVYATNKDLEIKVSERNITKNYTITQDSVIGVFTIINLTDNVINVLGIEKDCTCYQTIVSAKEINPKKSITLTMTVSVKNRKWIDTAVVLLLDTKQKYYKFRIKGERKLALAVGQE